MSKYLITGGAGFIGSHLTDRLLATPDSSVTCIDNYSDYYSRETKERNISGFLGNNRYRFIEQDIGDSSALFRKLEDIDTPDVIFHLAAMVGVRPSIRIPEHYYLVNVNGTLHILEFARTHGVQKIIFSSSSSVYGINPHLPWKESDLNLMPISPYASSKLSAEHLGQVYAHLYGIQFTALRLFTVYGSRQRPDMAMHKFIALMEKGEPIPLFGDGSSIRDYTHVSDIVSGTLLAASHSEKGFNCFNLGSGSPISLLDLVKTLENVTGYDARIDFQPEQAGDVDSTYADISHGQEVLGYIPRKSLQEGLKEFWSWKSSDKH